MLNALVNGLATGMILQLAIGPIFLYVAGLTTYHSTADGFVAVAAVSIVDYLFIALAILGVGKLLERETIKKVMGVGSSVVLFVFGYMMFRDAIGSFSSPLALNQGSAGLMGSFSKAFILTASSPLTIVFWTGIFTARSIEKGFNKKQLWVFGLSAGLTTPLFLGGTVIVFSILRNTISFGFATWLNLGVGSVLMVYGLLRFIKLLRNKEKQCDDGGMV